MFHTQNENKTVQGLDRILFDAEDSIGNGINSAHFVGKES
jgi:hypothetical protein